MASHFSTSSTLSTVISATSSSGTDRKSCALPAVHNTRPALRRRSSPGLPYLAFLRLGRGDLRVLAGITEIEPDLVEDKRDRWSTGGVSPEDFVYGEYDGHHTYFETNDKPSFWESVKGEYEDAEPPSGVQGIMAWLFLPAIIAGLAYDVPGEYLYIGAAVFVVVFCAIEMGKPDKPHNFEPQIYNMERKSRDKLIADYNTMDIWDFNEKYGDLWDFTVKRDRL